MNQTETTGVIDIVQEQISAFNTGDAERFKATLTRDAVMAFRAVDRVCRGADDITTAFWALRENFDDLHLQVTSAFSNGSSALVEMIRSANSATSGARVTIPECLVYTIRQNRVATISYYTDRMTELVQLGAISALEAPDLPEEPALAHPHVATPHLPRMHQLLRTALGRRTGPTVNG